MAQVVEAAARATINERCADAFLHDVRGSMQALFSALELLRRSATSGDANPSKAERVSELARRAIDHHEKSTLQVLRLLTLQRTAAAVVDAGALMKEVIHFLRNDAACKNVHIELSGTIEGRISTERAKLQTLLAGVLTAAIDAASSGDALPVRIDHRGAEVVISIGNDANYVKTHEVTWQFARNYLFANGGRLEIDPAPPGAVRIHYPRIVPGSE